MTALSGGLKQVIGYAENTKSSKKSQALRMTTLLGGLQYSLHLGDVRITLALKDRPLLHVQGPYHRLEHKVS
jgi:hypothetical protein